MNLKVICVKSVWKIIYFFIVLVDVWIVCSGQDDVDERCFLQTGGSTATFFVKEDLKVGSVVGLLRIKGDLGNDINLSLTSSSVPLKLDRQNLILTQPLDKEGELGPASVTTDVTCQRLGTSDPSFTIPVTVRVTDVNDNSPIFMGSPYQLNISEMTLPGTKIFRNIKAIDRDQPGPFSTIEYSVGESQHSDYVSFENPLDGSLTLSKQLDYETLQSFQIRIIARDQGNPSNQNETLLTINVQDADDQNPAFFYGRYEALLPQGSTEGQKLMVQPQELRAYDKDLGLGAPVFYTFYGNADEYKYFELNRITGHIYIMADIPETDFLQPVTLVVQATQFDNLDRYGITTLTISKGGIFDNDLQFVQHFYQAKILENVPLNNIIMTLLTNKPASKRVQFQIEAKTLPGEEFSVSQRGEVILRKALDYESTEFFSFNVTVNDGKKNDSAQVNITVININDWDPRFRYPQYEFFLEDDDLFDGFILGKLDVHDGDKGDRVLLDIRGYSARAFHINPQGELVLKDLSLINSTEANLVIVARDSGTPPRETSVPAIIHFPNQEVASLRQKEDEAFTLTVLFSLALAISLLVIICLSIYIFRQNSKKVRRISTSSLSNSSESNYNNNDLKVYEVQNKANTYGFGYGYIPGSTSNTPHPGNRSALSITRPESQLGAPMNPLNPLSFQNRGREKFVNLSLPANGLDQAVEHSSLVGASGPEAMRHCPEPNFTAESADSPTANGVGDLLRIQWPRSSISRRVKKLSWEDENEISHDRDISTLMTDPNLSFLPGKEDDARSNATSESLSNDKAVYF